MGYFKNLSYPPSKLIKVPDKGKNNYGAALKGFAYLMDQEDMTKPYVYAAG